MVRGGFLIEDIANSSFGALQGVIAKGGVERAIGSIEGALGFDCNCFAKSLYSLIC
jgi:hypothetical protein